METVSVGITVAVNETVPATAIAAVGVRRFTGIVAAFGPGKTEHADTVVMMMAKNARISWGFRLFFIFPTVKMVNTLNTFCAAQRFGVSRHRPERPSSVTTPNSGRIGGRLHAGLGCF
jgi:hypothetical protein